MILVAAMPQRAPPEVDDMVPEHGQCTRQNLQSAVRGTGVTQRPTGTMNRSSGLDAVFHIVGQVSLIRSYSDPTSARQRRINVLQLCLQSHVPRLLYASSMTVYGHTAVLPTPEDTACCPLSYYGITKYAAER